MRQEIGPHALGRPRGIGVEREVGGGIGMENTLKKKKKENMQLEKKKKY